MPVSAAKRVSICRSVKTSSARSISPRLVLADPQTLSTLPDAYFTDGMGEVIKVRLHRRRRAVR